MKNKKRTIIFLIVCLVGSFINAYFVPNNLSFIWGYMVGCIAFPIIGGE